jgi:hypothetical protein
MVGTDLGLSFTAVFKEFDADIFAGVTFSPTVSVALHTADPHVIKVR